MPYVALYREWRPKIFEDVIGQEHIIRTIKNQILSGKIPHAYLFCGTRGTGKTSTSKIFSKAVNCLNPQNGDPCNECEMCRAINEGTLMDVVEIDAASNTGVDNIRDLIDDVKYPPHLAKYKVYIIDEVHMLSLQAFNALLKTIEEPPSYVIFILATTDPQKVPPTILSRCQRFEFKRIKTEDMVKRLRQIVDKNGVLTDDKTLALISRVSDGAVRDAVSILDQSMSIKKGKVEYSDVVSMLGLTSGEYIFNIVNHMINHDVENSIRLVDEVILGGKDVLQFIKDLTKHFRNLLMIKVSKTPEEVIDASDDNIELLTSQARGLRSEEIMRGINILIQAENEVRNTLQSRILLEMAVVKFCKREYDTSMETLIARLNALEEKINSGNITVEAAPKVQAVKKPAAKKTAEVKEVDSTEIKYNNLNAESSIKFEDAKRAWKDVIELSRSYKATISALLNTGDIKEINGNVVTISFPKEYSFSKVKLQNPEDKKIVEDCFSKVLQTSVRIALKVEDEEYNIEGSIEKMKDAVGDDVPIEVIEE